MGMRENKERKQSLAGLDAKAASALPGTLQYFIESAKMEGCRAGGEKSTQLSQTIHGNDFQGVSK
jgi:hypothetical protein